MSRPRPIRRWDPFRPLDMLGTLWSTASAVPQLSAGAAHASGLAHLTAFLTLRHLVLGKRVTLRADSGPVTLTVSTLASRLDVRRLAVGQLDDVRATATDIVWRDSRFDHASAVLHNVHVRPGAPPTLVAAPVHLTVDVPTAALDELFATTVPRLAGTIGDDAVARIRFARRPRLGHLEVDGRLDGPVLVLTPRAFTLGRRRWRLPARVPAYRVRLPELPHGLQLTDVRVEPGLLRLSGTLPEWRMDFSRHHLEYLLDF